MKGKSLLKSISFLFLAFIVLTWLIPAGTYQSGTFVAGEVSPVGIYEVVRILLSIFSNYTIYGIIFLLIGALYGVMSKTGVYAILVDKMAAMFNGKAKVAIVLSIIIFALLGSVSGFNVAIFIIVPLFMAVLAKLGVDKLTTILATVGAIIIGNMGSTLGFEISGYLNLYYGMEAFTNIVIEILFLVAIVALTAFFTTTFVKVEAPVKKVTKKTTKKVEVKAESDLEIPFYVETKEKKNLIPLAIIFGLSFLVLIVGLFNFEYAFEMTLFTDIYTQMMEFELFGYPIVAYLFGTMNPFGSWNLGEIGFMLVLVSFIIGWVYSLSFSEILEGMTDGMKKMVKVAIVVIAANIIMYLVIPSSSTGMHSNIFVTINDFFANLGGETFNYVTTSISTIIGSVFYNDFKYLVDATAPYITIVNLDTTSYPAIALLYQGLHGLVMLVTPVSLVLVAGLTYLNVSIKEWFLYIWKLLLALLAVVVVFVLITSLFV